MIKFEETENIVKILRRHWFVMLPKILGLIFGALIPVLLYAFLSHGSYFSYYQKLGVESVIENIFSGKVLFWYSLWLLVLWVIFFIEWTDYYLDLWIITDRRIIDVEQKGFFHREVTSFTFNQIQDITVETKGLLETFLKFGTLHIQTAGHNRDIIIKSAQNPEEARSLVLKLQGK